MKRIIELCLSSPILIIHVYSVSRYLTIDYSYINSFLKAGLKLHKQLFFFFYISNYKISLVRNGMCL